MSEKRTPVTYEDAPAAVYGNLIRLIGKPIEVTVPATIVRVGSKAVVIEIETLYGKYGEVSVPIANLVVHD